MTQTASQIASSQGNRVIFRRFIATYIDLLFMFLILLFGDWVLGNELYQKTLWIWICFAILYPVILECSYGWTFGKLLLGLRVVQNDFKIPSLQKSLINHLIRIFEVYIVTLIGALVALNNSSQQRIGNKLADLYVVPAKDLVNKENSISN